MAVFATTTSILECSLLARKEPVLAWQCRQASCTSAAAAGAGMAALCHQPAEDQTIPIRHEMTDAPFGSLVPESALGPASALQGSRTQSQASC